MAATLAFLATLICLLMLTFSGAWFFGAALGEPIAFGFLALSVIAIVTLEERRGAVAGGVFAALAIVTKLIAVVSVIGLVAMYGLLVWRSLGRTASVRRVAEFALGAAVPLGTLELARLAVLGVGRFIDYWSVTALLISETGTWPKSFLERPGIFLTVIERDYLPLLALLFLIGGALAIALRSRPVSPAGEAWRSPMLLGLGAVIGHVAYFVLISKEYPRYLWIGLALAMFAIASVALLARPTLRLAAFAGVVALTLITGAIGPKLSASPYDIAARAHAERQNVVATLESEPATPYVAHWWSSLYDVVYLRRSAGKWAYGPSMARFQGQTIFTIINGNFTDQTTDFYRSVTNTCLPLTPTHTDVLAYRCEAPFWQEFLPSEALANAPADWSVESALVPGGRCNVDIVEGQIPSGAAINVNEPGNIWMMGWAVDPDSQLSPDATFVVLQGAESTYVAPAVIEYRPALAQNLGHAGWNRAGFRISIDARSIASESYRVLLVTQTDGRLRGCQMGLKLVV